MMRRFPFLARGRCLTALLATALLLTGCPSPSDPPDAPPLTLTKRSFGDLSGWASGSFRLPLAAFRRSCESLLNRDAEALRVPNRPAFGRARDWRPACTAALDLASPPSEATAQQFFETHFRPYQVIGRGDPEGLFTGYFEPQLHGARQQTERFSEPLHKRPSDLIRVDLDEFLPSLSTETLYGQVDGQRLVPYASRKAIDNGALAQRNLELLWVDDPVDKFFLQIQGSGRVLLPDSTVLRVGYDGENGHPYRAIGRDLIAMDEIPREEMSMQAIRAWMEAHPERRDDLMHRNPSYVFFRSLGTLPPHLGPVGAQGVPLTPGHSLAVDPSYIPYGAPLWLTARRPADARNDTSNVPLRRLLIAQDTGGAIRGAVRGDVFWGAGDRARSVAGRMQHTGRYAVLLPRALSPPSSTP